MKQYIKKHFKSVLRPWIWPIIRWRNDKEIHLITHYPKCTVKISSVDSIWKVEVNNGDPKKIPTQKIYDIFVDCLKENFPEPCFIERGVNIDFCLESVCLESWRDIYDGRISELIENNDYEFQTSKVGAFGFLAGETKPERLSFVNAATQNPEYFEFIATDKYSNKMINYISLVDYKKRYKYIIDLPGHTYSTKSYWMLFLKRPLFYVEPKLKFKWERGLKPWVHYIPVKGDFSDLLERYEWAERNTAMVEKMTKNLYKFGLETMAPEKVKFRLAEIIKPCLVKK